MGIYTLTIVLYYATLPAKVKFLELGLVVEFGRKTVIDLLHIASGLLSFQPHSTMNTLTAMTDEEAAITLAMLAQIGSNRRDAREENKPTQLWVKWGDAYNVVDLYTGNGGLSSPVQGPPPTGAFVLKVTRQE